MRAHGRVQAEKGPPPVGELGGDEGSGARTDGEAGPGLRCGHGKHERRGVVPVHGRGERRRRRSRRRRRPAQRAGPTAQRRPGPLRAGTEACGGTVTPAWGYRGDPLAVLSLLKQCTRPETSNLGRRRYRPANSSGSLCDARLRCFRPIVNFLSRQPKLTTMLCHRLAVA